MCSKVRSLWETCGRALETVAVKLKMTQKPQEVGEHRNTECLPRKVTGKENQPNREAMWAVTKLPIGVGLPSPLALTMPKTMV